MSASEAAAFYRKPSKKLRQGDIAMAEFVHLRTPRDLPGPGEGISEESLPYFGKPLTYEIVLPRDDKGHTYNRVLWVWQGPVMVIHQNCEIDWASEQDSRLTVAPIVLRSSWDGDHWRQISKDRVPGYFYLPSVSSDEAKDLGLRSPLPEAAVALAGSCTLGREVVRDSRIAGLTQTRLRGVQDAISRFYAVRGYGSIEDFAKLAGKRIVSIEDTDQSVEGPARLVKVFLGDKAEAEADVADDEVSLAYFGVRNASPRQARVVKSRNGEGAP